jgi:hypothetical protein
MRVRPFFARRGQRHLIDLSAQILHLGYESFDESTPRVLSSPGVPRCLPPIGCKDMKFAVIRGLLLLMMCTSLSVAAQDTVGTADGGCRQIAGQLPQVASSFGRGLAAAPRNAIQPRNLMGIANRCIYRAIHRVQ